MTPKSRDFQSLLRLIRNISRDRIPRNGLPDEVLVHEISGSPLVYSHWMSVILLTCSDLKITFKTHFKTRNAQLLAAPLFNLPSDRISTAQALDCMREYGNLTAGGVKHALLRNRELVLSLPILTRGFDEIFYADARPANTVYDRWRLAFRETEFICTVEIEASEEVDVAGWDAEDHPESENAMEIEYL